MNRKYDLILADPPWRYSFSRSDSRKIENQYSTMSLLEIEALGKSLPAKDNSVLFLWATAPKLLEAISVLKAWGFDYKTHAIWDKVKIGMGYWFRGQHELLLVGVRGKFKCPEPSRRIGSVFRSSRERHSKKPVSVHQWIEKAFPSAIKLEMFARETREGWDCWGDEIEANKEMITSC